ncbi:ATP-binding protein [Pandoraea sp. PE-S2R-1]|uniref:ATP-binding protein n=1 Tax=Pandoraea sp. PE-S2R-1 TaxID=1986994 RepID=UPI0014830487|nr:ATP-binding protein [Pandoraea sp. PE-S2R-1]
MIRIGEGVGLHNPPLERAALCDVHGEYVARCFIGKVWLGCPACSTEREERESAEAEAKARADRLRAWQRKIGDSGIPERFHDRRLSTYRVDVAGQRTALEFAEDYAANFDEVLRTGRCAIFIGKRGTGKTHLAAGIGLHIMERDNRSVYFTTVLRAIRGVKDTWTRGSTVSESQAIAALVFPDLLILDEVGVQFGSEVEKTILFDIMNERYEKRHPTILLSNLPPKEVEQYLGERVYDRLREDGGRAIVFDWESERGKVSA